MTNFVFVFGLVWSVWRDNQLYSTVSTPGKKLVVDTVRGREDKESNKGKNQRGEMYSQTLNQCDTIYTQYMVQNGTLSTPESISPQTGKRKRRGLRTTFSVRRERTTCESRSPDTSHKPYPEPSNTDTLSRFRQLHNVSLNLKRDTVRGTCCEREDRSIAGQTCMGSTVICTPLATS